MNLLEHLLILSEKAANIARICRQNPHLFRLLIQEKSADESNPRFVEDFKTLADVLIQETVKHDLGKEFPEMKKFIFGEENNVFENKLGDSITVEVLEDVESTSNLLRQVLNNDTEAAILLSEVVHQDICITDLNITGELPDIDSTSDLAIWIDPIDSTAEYINGIEKKTPSGICVNGLNCVTVLIGVFNRHTGLPIMGIINQPFFQQNDDKWSGRHFWSYYHHNSLKSPPTMTNKICLSSSEDSTIKKKLESAGFELVEAAGAGYKCLLVILGVVDAYILSKSTTFKWDTCAPQAVLNSLNGGLVNYQRAVDKKEIVPVTYDVASEHSENKLDELCNKGGIVAYNNEIVLNKILVALRD